MPVAQPDLGMKDSSSQWHVLPAPLDLDPLDGRLAPRVCTVSEPSMKKTTPTHRPPRYSHAAISVYCYHVLIMFTVIKLCLLCAVYCYEVVLIMFTVIKLLSNDWQWSCAVYVDCSCVVYG